MGSGPKSGGRAGRSTRKPIRKNELPRNIIVRRLDSVLDYENFEAAVEYH